MLQGLALGFLGLRLTFLLLRTRDFSIAFGSVGQTVGSPDFLTDITIDGMHSIFFTSVANLSLINLGQ